MKLEHFKDKWILFSFKCNKRFKYAIRRKGRKRQGTVRDVDQHPQPDQGENFNVGRKFKTNCIGKVEGSERIISKSF